MPYVSIDYKANLVSSFSAIRYLIQVFNPKKKSNNNKAKIK